MRLLFIILLAGLTQFKSSAQFLSVNIPGSQVRKINSSIVGQEYELQILLPGDYANSNKKYPVVYLMDSQWDFPLVSAIYGEQYYDGFIPGLIIVGVTWGGIDPKPDSLRARDYTPTHEKRMIQSGGADQFLSFMKKELFPFIELNYKADSTERILMGCSLGGLFTLYTLFTQPELFTGYAAASPAIGWDKGVLYKYEKEFASKKLSKPVRLYMTIGDVETSRPAYERFAAQMIRNDHASVNIHSKILENTGHSGTKSETYTRGLQYIFERPDLQFESSVLKKYEGSYHSPDGNKVEIIMAEKGILLRTGNDQFRLRAATETDFYSIVQFLNIHFKLVDGNVEGFQLDKYGSSQFIKKTNPDK